MIRGRLIYLILFAFTGMIAVSCSNTKFLTGDQMLYTGKKTAIIADSGKFSDRNTIQIIESVTAFRPNNAIGNKRVLPPVGLWVYFHKKPAENKKPRWMYRTFAKEPVLITNVDPYSRSQKLESELFNAGYFHSKVWLTIDTGKRNNRKAGITYFVRPGKPYRYNQISFLPPADEVDSIITNYKDRLSIKPDDIFDLGKVKLETRKITGLVQGKGYFYFNPSNMKWSADTTLKPYRIDLLIGRNADILPNAVKKYFIGNITVHISSSADTVDLQRKEETIIYDGISIVSRGRIFKPDVVSRSIYFRKGDVYSLSGHQQTLTHLNSYGVFKFVNIQYTPDPDTLVNRLNMLIELTPMKNISLDLEGNVVTESTGFAGPGFSATVAHLNVANGANKLQVKLIGGFEWQMGTSSSSTLGTFSYNVGVSSSMTFPKFIVPFRMDTKGRFKFPQTSVTLGFQFMNKIQYYRMRSLNISLNYKWRSTEKISHVLYPVYLNSIDLLNTTPEFDSILAENPYIRKSFEEQFIAGLKYDFIFDNNITKQTNGYYLQVSLGASGNLLDLIKKATANGAERPYSVNGSVYSQFVKISTDIRYYRNFRDNSFVIRLYSGIGYSYTNSVVMPYVEQYSSGGSNSIRAFIARSVGPGSLPPDPTSDIIDQTGDIKLEANLECRFKMTKVINGALFIDAGNIWLLNPDESRPGAEFHFKTFADQIAVGTGVGLRFDFSFFILRTDFGFPVRMAYPTDGSNWIGSSKDFFDHGIFNLAIGYPF
jgi:outer membrane protein insertion porin family